MRVFRKSLLKTWGQSMLGKDHVFQRTLKLTFNTLKNCWSNNYLGSNSYHYFWTDLCTVLWSLGTCGFLSFLAFSSTLGFWCFLLLLLWCWWWYNLLLLGVKVGSIVISLSSQDHNLESLEVIKSVSLVLTIHLEVRWGLFPCRCNFLFLSLLFEGTGSSSLKNVSNLELG